MADILVIDDDADVRGTVRKILEADGHEVRQAADGREGVRQIHDRLPDLVITDLIMPEKEGIETILELRATYPELPILAVSGGGTNQQWTALADAEMFGADATLAKPFTVEKLQSEVRRLLEG